MTHAFVATDADSLKGLTSLGAAASLLQQIVQLIRDVWSSEL